MDDHTISLAATTIGLVGRGFHTPKNTQGVLNTDIIENPEVQK